MSVIVVATAFPAPEHRADVVKAFETVIASVHDEPGCELDVQVLVPHPAGTARQGTL
ncbi:MAG TPA: antibiotic biosynthesis monooxygenase [Trebonia sp.]